MFNNVLLLSIPLKLENQLIDKTWIWKLKQHKKKNHFWNMVTIYFVSSLVRQFQFEQLFNSPSVVLNDYFFHRHDDHKPKDEDVQQSQEKKASKQRAHQRRRNDINQRISFGYLFQRLNSLNSYLEGRSKGEDFLIFEKFPSIHPTPSKNRNV